MLVFLLPVCLGAVAAVPSNPQRIVGGSVTTIQQYPSIASLLWSQEMVVYTQVCGGIILNQRSVLTGAHCTIGDLPARWRVRVGSTCANSGGTVYSVSQIINHASYRRDTYDNDLAILRTGSNILFSNSVRPASIAGSNYNLGDNLSVLGVGWGNTSLQGAESEQLRHVEVWTVNQNTCRNNYATISMTITDNMFCTGWLNDEGRDQCQGDSGGPIYHKNVVVGITSWGNGCARHNYPGVNARVSRFASWIDANA